MYWLSVMLNYMIKVQFGLDVSIILSFLIHMSLWKQLCYGNSVSSLLQISDDVFVIY